MKPFIRDWSLSLEWWQVDYQRSCGRKGPELPGCQRPSAAELNDLHTGNVNIRYLKRECPKRCNGKQSLRGSWPGCGKEVKKTDRKKAPVSSPHCTIKVLAKRNNSSLNAKGQTENRPYPVTNDTEASMTFARPNITPGQPKMQSSQPYILQTVSGEILPALKEVMVELTLGQCMLWMCVCQCLRHQMNSSWGWTSCELLERHGL
jgi:hypothetical protein